MQISLKVSCITKVQAQSQSHKPKEVFCEKGKVLTDINVMYINCVRNAIAHEPLLCEKDKVLQLNPRHINIKKVLYEKGKVLVGITENTLTIFTMKLNNILRFHIFATTDYIWNKNYLARLLVLRQQLKS